MSYVCGKRGEKVIERVATISPNSETRDSSANIETVSYGAYSFDDRVALRYLVVNIGEFW